MESRLVTSFCEMVQIDSESGDEAAFIDHVRAVLERDLDATCQFDDYGNLVARVAAKESTRAKPILLAAHGDTVRPGKGIEPVVKDGAIRSAGETILGADDKAGVAALIEAVRTASRRPPVEVVITRQEEVGLVGAKHLDLSLVSAKTGFIIDGEESDVIVIGGPSHVSLDVTIVGKAAHAGVEPERGVSAIRAAAMAIANQPTGRIDEETTANIGTIHGGLIRNGVPERVTIQAECRSLDHEKCMRQAETMRRAFEDAAASLGAKADVQVTLEYEASRVPESSQAVKLAKEAIAALGLEPKTRVITGGTDALILASRGLDAVVLGYGGQAAHTTDEFITVDALEQSATVLRNLLEAAA
jgi:tripeptide aminopeptidase